MPRSGATTADEAVAAASQPPSASLAPSRTSLVVAFVLAVVAAGGPRLWQVAGTVPLGWNDTTDFLSSSRAPWSSSELWAGRRPVAVPALLKLVGADLTAYVHWQVGLAVACWAALAVSVATVVPGRARWPAAAAVVAFSLTSPVTMWERSVLSESLALSLLALVLAAAIQVARGVTGRRVAALLVAAALWSATRDSHASVLLVGGAAALVAVAVWWVRARRHGDRDEAPRGRALWAVLGGGLVVIALVAAWGSARGERHAFPMRNVYEVRVLPYPERVEWFADHGMPQAEEFMGPDARVPYREQGLPPVVYVGDDDAELGPWLDWVGSDGRLAFARFVASHPTFVVTEPLRTPERAFNNARGDRGFYAPPDMRAVPAVDRVLALSTPLVLVVAAAALAWVAGRRRWTPAFVAGSVAAALAVPHGVLAWHSDGMETARHLAVPAAQLHAGVLLMAVGAVGAPLTRQGKGRSRPGYGRDMADETPLTIHRPSTPPIGGVVVVQEAFGITDHIEDVCRRLADVGWLAVAPHLYHRTGDPVLPYDDFSQVAPHAGELTPESILADVDAALAFIEDAGFPADVAGVVGFCMGGTVALAAAVERQVGAAVSFYGGGVAKSRFGFPALVDAAPKLRAPWLGLYGDRDSGIPVEQVEQLREAAAQADVPTEVVRYEAAGHGFNRDGSDAYDEAASTDAWERMLDWFARHLTTGATEVSG